jgi:hypothetical protein
MDRDQGIGRYGRGGGIHVAGRHGSSACGAGGDYPGTQSDRQKQET